MVNLLMIIFTRKGEEGYHQEQKAQTTINPRETKELTNQYIASISISLEELHHHTDNHLV
jgi:hypothetical protein